MTYCSGCFSSFKSGGIRVNWISVNFKVGCFLLSPTQTPATVFPTN
jgi:hypothetical protein